MHPAQLLLAVGSGSRRGIDRGIPIRGNTTGVPRVVDAEVWLYVISVCTAVLVSGFSYLPISHEKSRGLTSQLGGLELMSQAGRWPQSPDLTRPHSFQSTQLVERVVWWWVVAEKPTQ